MTAICRVKVNATLLLLLHALLIHDLQLKVALAELRLHPATSQEFHPSTWAVHVEHLHHSFATSILTFALIRPLRLLPSRSTLSIAPCQRIIAPASNARVSPLGRPSSYTVLQFSAERLLIIIANPAQRQNSSTSSNRERNVILTIAGACDQTARKSPNHCSLSSETISLPGRRDDDMKAEATGQ